MNTIEELERYGINKKQAEKILEIYRCRIGYRTVDYEVTDIEYKGEQEREIELTCIHCGKKVYKRFANRKNKWSELQKNCECKKNSKKQKETNRNDKEEYIGKKYGDYEVIGFVKIPFKNKSGSKIYWKCKCVKCGIESNKVPASLKNGQSNICSIHNKKEIKEIDYSSYIGQKYNRLEIVSFQRKNQRMYAICKCECGNYTDVQMYQLTKGIIKSCGCYRNDLCEDAISRSELYPTWYSMKNRCENPKNEAYAYYGGRGIKVCDEWRDFRKFEKWAIENGYDKSQGLSLDRIDVNKGYSPDNCRFANKWVQLVNQRPRNKNMQRVVKGRYEVDGVYDTKKNWCKKYGVSEATVTYRLNYMGMTFKEALIAEKKTEGNHQAALNLKIKNPNLSKQNAVDTLNRCQSYIETNLYLAFIRITDKYNLIPQYKIGKYIVDFFVKEKNVVVECDGYDYHKTKEQLDNDCKRQRYLTMEGYKVFRFSGVEINRNPNMCAEELLNILENGKQYENIE